MHRRSLLLSALATSLLPAAARAERGDILPPDASRTVALRLPSGRVVVVQAVALGGHGLRWRGGAMVHAEDRFDLSALGGLFRQPFARRWDQGMPLGGVSLAGDTLVGTAAGAALAGRRVVLGAGSVSWDLPGLLAPMGGMPGGGEALGEMRMGGDGAVLLRLAAEPVL